MDTMTTLKGETGRDARRRIRAGGHRLPTSGMAITPGRPRRSTNVMSNGDSTVGETTLPIPVRVTSRRVALGSSAAAGHLP